MKPAYKLMTGLLTVVVLTMTAITAHAQAIQPGVVMRYYESKEKQPLPGVQLEIVKAGTHISGPDGTFTLKFNSLKPGDRVIVSKIIKPGFELFNKTDISNWIISRNRVPFTIILVNSADFNRQKNETRQLVTNNYKARYEEKVRELERLRRANKLQEKEFLSREKELKRQMEEFKSNIDAYIDNFVRIDLSEISAEELKILKLFKDGHAQEAYDAYKNLHLVEKLDHEIDSYISITKRMRDDFKNLCDAVLRKADTFVLMDKMDDAREELEALLEKLKPLVEMHPDAFIPQIATIRFRLGDLAIKDILTDDEEATEHLIIAKDLYLKLNEEFPGMYRADLAMTQERLGQVYVKSDSLEAAEQLYLHALENWKQILAGDPDNMDDLGNMARVKQRLGALYTDRYGHEVWNVILSEDRDTTSDNVNRILGIKAKAVSYYTEAFDTYDKLKKHDPFKYYQALAEAEKELAFFYITYNDIDEARNILLSLIQQMEEALTENYSDAFIVNMVDARMKLADEVYRMMGLKEKREECLIAALDLCTQNLTRSPNLSYKYREVFEDLSLFHYHDPGKNGRFIESCLNTLSHLCDENTDSLIILRRDDVEDKFLRYLEQNDKDRFETYCKEKISHYKEPFLKEPTKYESRISYFYRQLHSLYGQNTKTRDKAEEIHLEEIGLWETLYKQNPERYRSGLNDRYLFLSRFYTSMKEDDKAKVYIDKGLKLTARQKTTNVKDLENKALLLIQQGDASKDYAEKEKCYLSALEFYYDRYSLNPQRYDTDWLYMLESMGRWYYKRREYEKAVTHFKTALEKRVEHFISFPSDYDRVWDTLSDLGETYKAQGENQKAEMMWRDIVAKSDSIAFKYKEKSYAMFEALEKAYSKLGSFYTDNNDYGKAISTYSTLLEKARTYQEDNSTTYKFSVARIHESLGNLLCAELNQKQDLTQAVEHYKAAFDIFAERPQTYLEDLARLQEGMGSAYYRNCLRDGTLSDKAEENLLEASQKYYRLWQYDFAQIKNSPFKERYINVQLLLGDLYEHTGEVDKAKKHYALIQRYLEEDDSKKALYNKLKERGLLDNSR